MKGDPVCLQATTPAPTGSSAPTGRETPGCWDSTDLLAARRQYDLERWHALTRRAVQRVERATRAAGTDRGYIAWSGGKDGTAAAAIATKAVPGMPVVSFRCGLEFPETVRYQEQVAERLGWNWHTIQTGDALSVLEDSGLWGNGETPKPEMGLRLFEVAIEEPSKAAIDRFGPLIVWGLRADEARRRRLMLFSYSRDGVVQRSDGTVTCAPCADWTITDVWAMHYALGVGPNPVYKTLADLGVPPRGRRVDIMVGADGLGTGRMGWLRAGWPTEWAKLVDRLPRIAAYA